MTNKNNRIYNRTLKLAVALGDWTTLKVNDTSETDIHVSSVQSVSFDSLPRDKMKKLHMQHYQFADRLIKSLSKDMDIKMELHTVHARQVPYQHFLKTQEEMVIQSDFYIQNKGRINLIFDWGLAEMMVNRLVGGKGEIVATGKTFTELEKVALEVQMEGAIPLLSQSWGNAIKEDELSLDFNIGYYRYDKKIALRQAYVIFEYALFFGDEKSYKIIMAYPSDILRHLMSQQDSQEGPLSPKIKLEMKTLKKTKIPIEAQLGKTELTMEHLKSLKYGSIIMLNSKLNEPLNIKIGKGNFLVQLGIKNGQLVLQLLEPNKSKNKKFEYLIPSKVQQKENKGKNSDVIETDMQDKSELEEIQETNKVDIQEDQEGDNLDTVDIGGNPEQ